MGTSQDAARQWHKSGECSTPMFPFRQTLNFSPENSGHNFSLCRNAIEGILQSTIPAPNDRCRLPVENHNLHVLLAIQITFYLQKEISDQWRTSRTVILHKRGGRIDIPNRRPICAIRVLYKSVTKDILQHGLRTVVGA